jgi:hypothetical protein
LSLIGLFPCGPNYTGVLATQELGKSHQKDKRASSHLYGGLAAIHFNTDLKEKYLARRAFEKPAKGAIVVVMRKLIIKANVLLPGKRMWTERWLVHETNPRLAFPVRLTGRFPVPATNVPDIWNSSGQGCRRAARSGAQPH